MSCDITICRIWLELLTIDIKKHKHDSENPERVTDSDDNFEIVLKRSFYVFVEVKFAVWGQMCLLFQTEALVNYSENNA